MATGVVVARSDLLITTADWPALPPAESPGVVLDCLNVTGHLHVVVGAGASNVTLAGIGFTNAIVS